MFEYTPAYIDEKIKTYTKAHLFYTLLALVFASVACMRIVIILIHSGSTDKLGIDLLVLVLYVIVVTLSAVVASSENRKLRTWRKRRSEYFAALENKADTPLS